MQNTNRSQRLSSNRQLPVPQALHARVFTLQLIFYISHMRCYNYTSFCIICQVIFCAGLRICGRPTVPSAVILSEGRSPKSKREARKASAFRISRRFAVQIRCICRDRRPRLSFLRVGRPVPYGLHDDFRAFKFNSVLFQVPLFSPLSNARSIHNLLQIREDT